MHDRLATRHRRRRRDERGTVALIVAMSLAILLVVTAMVLDFGLARVDRQVNKSAADAAAVAGIYALDRGDGNSHPFAGICKSIRYLSQNDDRFSTLSDTAGTWTDGNGSPKANGCTDTSLLNQICIPGNTSTWARFTWTGTYQSEPIQVTIQSGYELSGSGFAEESLAAVAADQGDASSQGCDQLAVTISQNRKPGLGSLATSSDLVTTIRSVGRVVTAPGDSAPAMLLLKRTGCPLVEVAAGGSGAGSYIRVFGAMSSDGKTQAGTVHADTDGLNCPSNSYLLYGKAADGIVAYAAPLATNPSQPDISKPGVLSTVAGMNGVSINTIRDSSTNVYGSAALSAAAAGSASKYEPVGRPLVTRALIDNRYLGSAATGTGVRAAVAAAESTVFSQGPSAVTSTNYTSKGYSHFLSGCTPDQTAFNGLTATDRLWIDCTHNNGFRPAGTITINAGAVVFNGSVKPAGDLRLPNAHHVYVFGASSDAFNIGNNTAFRMHTSGNTVSGRCSTSQSTQKAVLFVKNGAFKQSGTGSLQMCYTTVFMMGGSSTACIPTSAGTAPTQTPCSGSTGNGQFSQNGGNIDWTAPNTLDVTTDSEGIALPAAESAWLDKDGPEDLALWSESAGSNNPTYNMNGGGAFYVRGVYMVPNADPFIIGGGASMALVNAQYIASSLALNGTTQLGMLVDPNSAVTLPELDVVGLVR